MRLTHMMIMTAGMLHESLVSLGDVHSAFKLQPAGCCCCSHSPAQPLQQQQRDITRQSLSITPFHRRVRA